MKKIVLSLILFLTSLSVFAQDGNNKTSELKKLTTESKIDTIYILQKKIYRTVKREPLKNKKYGIDINPIRLLLFRSNTDFLATSFSGGVSFFNINRNAELYFPIYYHSENITYYYDHEKSHIFSIGCRYRYFLGNTQYGWFIGPFLRYANIAYKYTDNQYSEDNISFKDNRIGIGVEFGYRIFSYRGLYWGIATNFGRYINGDFSNDNNYSEEQEFIYNLEIFKIGWAF